MTNKSKTIILQKLTALGSAALFLSLMTPAMAMEGHWVAIAQDESEAPECEIYEVMPIQASVRNNRFYGWAQIGESWHKVSGRVDENGNVRGHISAAEALDPEAVPSRSFSKIQFSMQIDGTVAAGNWGAPSGCNGKITAYQP